MSLQTILATLEEVQEEHERLVRSERRALDGLAILKAENAELRERPNDMRRLHAQIRSLQNDLSLTQRELRIITGERDALRNDLVAERHARQIAEDSANNGARDELQQTRRKLAAAIATNTRLSAMVAELQDQVTRAGQDAERARRAMLDHAGRM